MQTNRQKNEKKIISLLFGYKPDKRTTLNAKKVFNFVLNQREFTVPQVSRDHISSTWFYKRFLGLMLRAKIFEEAGAKESAGALGETKIYKITDAGLLVGSFITENISVAKEVLRRLGRAPDNPLLHFSTECLLKNYSNEVLWSMMAKTFCHALSGRKLGKREDKVFLPFIESVFDANIYVTATRDRGRSEKNKTIEKNFELLKTFPDKEYVFWYIKNTIELHLLNVLTGEKIRRYYESCWNTPKLFHVPCLNEGCNEVIETETLILPVYCEKCSRSRVHKERPEN